MNKFSYPIICISCITLIATGCAPKLVEKIVDQRIPQTYTGSQDSASSAEMSWKEFFTDTHLIELIDTALQNNQELNIVLQEIEVSRQEIRERKGDYLPLVNLGAGAGADKVGRYTRNGAVEANHNIEGSREFPEPLGDYTVGAYANWEVDIWRKLRNAKQSAVMRYLASVEGKNFMVTHLVAEVADAYYELLALDNELAIIQRNIAIQSNALEVVRLQKQSAKVTELAVKRFEAQLLNTEALQYDIRQQIIEAENRINFLVGRFPQPVERSAQPFSDLLPTAVYAGLPSDLLQYRPDITQAEQQLAAAKLDVKVARANFYPSLDLRAGVGLQAFNPAFLMTPESIIYSAAGELMAPLINRNAIKAMYYGANAKQVQAVFNYEQTVLQAYIEVVNQLARINNLEQRYTLKDQQVQALTESIEISNNLFRSARADYMEVLLTQREALEARFELIETKQEQMNAMVKVYQALGGGWN